MKNIEQNTNNPDVSTLSETGKKILTLLLQPPEITGRVNSRNIKRGGYLAYISKDPYGYLIVKNDVLYERDSMTYPVEPDITERETCIITRELMHEAVSKIRPGSSILVHGKGLYRYENHKTGPVDYDYLNENLDSTTEYGISIQISVPTDMSSVKILVARGIFKSMEDLPPEAKYVQFERSEMT